MITKKKQRGFFCMSNSDFLCMVILFGAICGGIGWGTIEGIRWIARHIEIHWSEPAQTHQTAESQKEAQ